MAADDAAIPPQSLPKRHARFLNHLLTCARCYAPIGRYCDDGSGLRRRHRLEFHVRWVLAAAGPAGRAHRLTEVPEPELPAVKRAVAILWLRRRKSLSPERGAQ